MLFRSIPVQVNDFTFYPNPSGGKIWMHQKIPANLESIRIYDAMGKLCYSCDPAHPQQMIDLRFAGSGLYLYIVTAKDGYSFSGKLLIE